MLSALGKPIIEKQIERLVSSGIPKIHIALLEHPVSAQIFLGNGSRWGIEISTYVFQDVPSPIDLAKSIFPIGSQVVIFPCELCSDIDWKAIIKKLQLEQMKTDLEVVFPDSKHLPQQSNAQIEPKSAGILCLKIDENSNKSVNQLYYDTDWLLVDSPEKLYYLNTLAISGKLQQWGNIKELTEEGSFCGHHTYIGPNVAIENPVYVGNYVQLNSGSRILSGSVINDGVVIDQGALIKSAVVFSKTYIGVDTNLENSIAAGNHVYNIGIGTWVTVIDPVILAELKDGFFGAKIISFVDRIIAGFLLLLTFPVWVTKMLIRKLKGKKSLDKQELLVCDLEVSSSCPAGLESGEFRVFDSSGPFVSRLAGLFDVVSGRLRLVGVRRLSHANTSHFTEEWTRERFGAPAGLFTPVDALGLNNASEHEKIMAENQYVATRNLRQDFVILSKALWRLLTG
jgi:NDP-sugar pyrophosphorylase family protein